MLPDGVYIRLPFEEYLSEADGGRLGSTDLARLWLRGPGWWWSSRHNPFRGERKSSPELTFGSALHAALLEGMAAYENRYCIRPDKRQHPDALFTIEQIKGALRFAGVHLGATSGWAKEDWCDAAELYLPDRVVWDSLQAEFERRHNGRDPLSAEEDFAIRTMRDLVVQEAAASPDMREIFSAGSDFPILAEISVLWTDDDGLRHRARFDKMLPVCTVDLKSWGNYDGRDAVQFGLDDQIKKMGYDVQCAAYGIARAKAFEMVLSDESTLHGGTEEERDHFVAMAEWCRGRRADWVWVFAGKPAPSGVAPIILPLREPFGGPYHRAGYRKRWHALETYKRCMAEFGAERPWGRVEPIHYASEDAGHGEPHIQMGMRGWGPDDAPPDEAEYFG